MIENRARAFVAALIGVVLVGGSPVAARAATADSKVAAAASKDNKKDAHTGKNDKKNEKADKRHDKDDRRRDRKDHGKDRDRNHNDDRTGKHRDERNRNWDHSRDADHRSHDWDTDRRYYQYGYYGSGYYDDCGYYGAGYRGGDYRYYGPDACSYEYGGYGSAYLVRLSGDQVGPGGGAPDAVGTANLEIDRSAGRLCYRLAYDGVSATGAQIREGRPGENGRAVVALDVGPDGDDGCIVADPQILSEIQNDPRGYHLSVDGDGYPDGAMRGQLEVSNYGR